MKANITIEGKPVGKGRPKFAREAQFVRAYTPKQTSEYEEIVRTVYQLKAKDEHHQTIFFDKDIPLQVIIKAYYPIPKSASKKNQELMKAGRIRPCVKPDFDNVAKIICDALNGIAYADDKQIVDSYIGKYYSVSPRVEITIAEIESSEMDGKENSI